jgi:hopanoid C-3 methylase HpnR
MYSEIYLRLEPLGLELVADAAIKAGHDIRILDLQIFKHRDFFHELEAWKPGAIGFSLNYLANIPEVIDLAREARRRLPDCFIFAGGHSASFTAPEILEHADGAIDCVVRGEGEIITPRLLEAAAGGRNGFEKLPGIVTRNGSGPHPELLDSLERHRPPRRLMRRRRKYFIGVLDPCASIEFTRGCPWDCSFCSAWTFYGRSYRKVAPEAAADDLESVREPHLFIVDDVAFIHPEHGFAIGKEIERRGIRKKFYLETRGDVLLRNKEVFEYWKRLGLRTMFLGLESIDEEGLKAHRKRITLSKNFEALEYARSLGITVAVNLIADPGWDERRFEIIREWAMSVPEIVHLTVNTPYPGTETWVTESRKFTTRDYRLFDVQHAVLPTNLPLERFYHELVKTQAILNRKHLGMRALLAVAGITTSLLSRGQTNFFRMLWKFHRVYNARRQAAEHDREVRYRMKLPDPIPHVKVEAPTLYVHHPEVITAAQAG